MFSDPAARSAWRLYLLRAELTLGSVSANVRRELLDDLAAHVRDIVAHDSTSANELDVLRGALARVGDPREFLAPLLEDAIFRRPHRDAGLPQASRALVATIAQGSKRALEAVAILFMALTAALTLLVSVGSTVRPENIGLFSLGPDDIQLRLLGGDGGTPIFAPWIAIGLAVLGCLLARTAWMRARQLVLALLVQSAAK